jgi:hypothetical protein
MKTTIVLALAFGLLVCWSCPVLAQYAVPLSVFDMGFALSTAPNTILKSAVGQSFVGSSTSASLFITSGFLPGADYVVDVDEQTPLPIEYQLYQNYPNPFNPTTTIAFDLPKTGVVSIRVYNILGQEVTNVLDEEKEAGRHKMVFNASQLASGAYFYRIQAGSFVQTKKMLILR